MFIDCEILAILRGPYAYVCSICIFLCVMCQIAEILPRVKSINQLDLQFTLSNRRIAFFKLKPHQITKLTKTLNDFIFMVWEKTKFQGDKFSLIC